MNPPFVEEEVLRQTLLDQVAWLQHHTACCVLHEPVRSLVATLSPAEGKNGGLDAVLHTGVFHP